MADFAARVCQGHIGRAKYFATYEKVRSNRKVIMQLLFQLGSLADAFQAEFNDKTNILRNFSSFGQIRKRNLGYLSLSFH